MSDLTRGEKRKLERLFGMATGYVLNFSDRTFAEFVDQSIGRDIFDQRYNYASGSKANRLRGFWTVESNSLVGKLLNDLIAYGRDIDAFRNNGTLPDECDRIGQRLRVAGPVPDLDALRAPIDERDFETLAAQVREAIEKRQPQAGLDRLHTFVVRFTRTLCEKRGIVVARDKPLHSLFGEYVKRLRSDGVLASEMALRILKSSISILEAFNDVRNNRSLAHDNPLLDYDESLLIFNHVAASIRFIRSIEVRTNAVTISSTLSDEDIPF